MNLLKRVIAAVRFHQIPRQSAAITFYALLSLAPILVLFVSLASEILQQTEIGFLKGILNKIVQDL